MSALWVGIGTLQICGHNFSFFLSCVSYFGAPGRIFEQFFFSFNQIKVNIKSKSTSPIAKAKWEFTPPNNFGAEQSNWIWRMMNRFWGNSIKIYFDWKQFWKMLVKGHSLSLDKSSTICHFQIDNHHNSGAFGKTYFRSNLICRIPSTSSTYACPN